MNIKSIFTFWVNINFFCSSSNNNIAGTIPEDCVCNSYFLLRIFLTIFCWFFTACLLTNHPWRLFMSSSPFSSSRWSASKLCPPSSARPSSAYRSIHRPWSGPGIRTWSRWPAWSWNGSQLDSWSGPPGPDISTFIIRGWFVDDDLAIALVSVVPPEQLARLGFLIIM